MDKKGYSFIIEFDEATDIQMERLTNFFNKNNIKFQVLKSDYELKKEMVLQQQLKKKDEVIEKAIEYIKTTTAKNDELNCTKLLADIQVEQLLEILEDKEVE